MLRVSTDSPLSLAPLAGGVSSDIYRVDAGGRTLCVKRALPKLKVAGDWQAPVERNRSEVAWLRQVGALCPGHAPRILGEDAVAGLFAMEWLPPDTYPVWKDQLRDGLIVDAEAAAVGDVLGRIHAATADDAATARRFANDAIFHAIRLEPYLVATGRAHADLAGAFAARVDTTLAHKRVLVHGDYSPKNILIGPAGPVILDAECAWFGDPAFDVAFVANHLLLKGLWRVQWRGRYLSALAALVDAYRAHAHWERWSALEARIAALLPALLLARADGKSPAEYLTADDKVKVRAFARPRIVDPPMTIVAIAEAWGRG
ncbi:MAG TPA: aminoglycoside phosphotransferase family protein [Casimicrobiaceae bacterium]|nr:aminoglycoside phosphotransferase family protein [Casimicrobiaceae bacterium]